MKTQTKIDLTDSGIQKTVRAVLSGEAGTETARGTYLHSLIGAVQTELGAKPRMEGRGRTKPVSVEAALAALNAQHARFYAIVLGEIDPELDATTRNSQSGFARSAASTLRGAIRLGLNPLEVVIPATTKASLRAWVQEHRPEPAAPDLTALTAQASRLAKRIAALLANAGDAEKAAVLLAVQRDLAPVNPAPVASRAAVLPFVDRRKSAMAA